jgi:hypothetical protein
MAKKKQQMAGGPPKGGSTGAQLGHYGKAVVSAAKGDTKTAKAHAARAGNIGGHRKMTNKTVASIVFSKTPKKNKK